MKNLSAFIGAILVSLLFQTFLGGCACTCAKWQPQKNPNGAMGIPGPGIFAFGNRVIYGNVLSEREATWRDLDSNIFFHFKANPNLILTPEQKKEAAEGTRVVIGPSMAARKTYAAVRSYPLYDRTNALTHDLCAEVNMGYAAAWGWRPYVRLQRISAVAEGTEIAGQVRESTNTRVVERIYLLENVSSRPVRVLVLNTGAVLTTLTQSYTYVEATTDLTANPVVTRVGNVQPIPPGDPFATLVERLME